MGKTAYTAPEYVRQQILAAFSFESAIDPTRDFLTVGTPRDVNAQTIAQAATLDFDNE